MTDRPDTVRALVAAPERPGGIDLATVAAPSPTPDQALVAVSAVSLNRGEVRRLAAAPSGWRPGWDLAGTVVASAADGTGPAIGRRVVGLMREGAWAEQVAVPTRTLATIPDGLAFTAAATLPVAGLTAYRTLQQADVVEGRRVLVTGASGGVGRFAIQLASHWGAEVTAVVGRPERADGLRELGAAEVSVGMPPEGAFDIILESVGGESLARALELVAPQGIVVTYGSSSGETTTFDVTLFYPKHGARLQGFLIFSEVDRLDSAKPDLGALAVLMCDGNLDPQIDLELPWSEAATAVDELLARRVDGKAVLRVE
ncbi:MAG: zinc-binding dehydrogenase [Acidimicrobiales bacterium]